MFELRYCMLRMPITEVQSLSGAFFVQEACICPLSNFPQVLL